MKSLFFLDCCLDLEVLIYDFFGSCCFFWVCDGGELILMCCLYGMLYYFGIGCFLDNKCKDFCLF